MTYDILTELDHLTSILARIPDERAKGQRIVSAEEGLEAVQRIREHLQISRVETRRRRWWQLGD